MLVAKKMKKEETVTLQDADGNDFVQIVDVISSKKVMSDWRSEFAEGAAWQKSLVSLLQVDLMRKVESPTNVRILVPI